MIISAKEFALHTGFPVKLVRRLCRTGILEHWLSGRVYLLDEEKALARMQMLKAQPIYQPKRTARCRNVNRLPEQYASRTERLKALIVQRKTAGAGTPTVKN
jgi:hypothetical protein